MGKLLLSITSYLEYVNKNCALNVSVHFEKNILHRLPQKALYMLLNFNSHKNPYCMAVKRKYHHKCICHQKDIIEKNSSTAFLCTCHAGVLEYIYPLLKDNVMFGFVSVSGYRETCPSLCVDTLLWKNSLCKDKIPKSLCDTVIPPLVIMLEQLFSLYAKETDNEYNMIVQFLNEYHNNITLADLCSYFGRSKSYISHMFKKESGMTICSYCNNLKLEDAKSLLINTNIPVSEIAFDTGFNDVSYFIYLFRSKYGVSPLKYRNNLKKQNEEVLL